MTPRNVPAFPMRLDSWFISFIVSSVATLVPASNDAGEPPSTDSVPAATAWLKQNLQCRYDSDSCPEFLSQDSWDQETARCCPGGLGSGLTLHVQRTEKGGCVWACLTATTCQAGEFPLVEEEHKDKTRYARVTCELCKADHFDPNPSESYKRKNSICRERHQRCLAVHGEALVRAGNTTHDALCRCSWEEGFSPSQNTCRCTGPAGFDGNTFCICQRHDCQNDMQLNHEFKCVPTPPSTSTEIPESASHTTSRSVETPEATTPKPVVHGDGTEEADSGQDDVAWKITVALFVICFVAYILVMYCTYNRV